MLAADLPEHVSPQISIQFYNLPLWFFLENNNDLLPIYYLYKE